MDSILKKILLCFALSVGSTLALTGGPTMPEYTSFAEFDAKDLVDLNTGNFHYTIPLMEVPGNGGSYPITLGYYSGIKQHQEASWVGLGWNLNAGAITRTVREYADDYNNAMIRTHIYDPGQEGWGMSIGGGYGPYGGSLTFDSNTGFGFIASVNVLSAIAMGNNGMSDFLNSYKIVPDVTMQFGYSGGNPVANVGAGVTFHTGNAWGANIGLRLGGEIGTAGISASTRLKLTHASTYAVPSGQNGGNKYVTDNKSMASIGYSWNSKSGGSFGYSILGATATTSSGAFVKNDIRVTSDKIGITIPIGYTGYWVSLGGYWWEWYLDHSSKEYTHGYLYQGGAPELVGHGESRATFDDKGNTLERRKDSLWLFPSQDIYYCNGHGIAGSFLPHTINASMFIDSANNSEGRQRWGKYKYSNGDLINSSNKLVALKGHKDSDDYLQYSTEHKSIVLENSSYIFRFTDEVGGNFVTDGENDYSRINYGDNVHGGKQILPIINELTGLLEGFDIIDIDGKKYEFRKPLYNWAHAAYATSSPENLLQLNDSERRYNKQSNVSPFAYSWLITAIKSPDYIDCGEPGPDEEDYGFWTKFTYQGNKYDTESPYQYVWRSPFEGTERVGGKSYSASIGIKDVAYLRSIETATHKAVIGISERKDMKGISEKRFDLEADVFFEASHDKSLGINNDGKVHIEIKHPYASHILNIIDNAKNGSYELPFLGVNIYEDNYNMNEWQNGHTEYSGTLSSDEIEFVEYNENEKVLNIQTSIPIKSSTTDTLYKHGLIVTCFTRILFKEYFKSIGTLHGFSDNSFKCDSITLLDKATSKVTKKIDFNYDYSLCKGVPNATDESNRNTGEIGKLTLKSITSSVLTRDGKWASIPDYAFGYFTPGGNPNFTSIKDYDIWGMNTTSGEANKHVTRQNYNEGIAWNLTDILTPEGTKVQIEYERDEFFGVSNKTLTAYEMALEGKLQKVSSLDELQDSDRFVGVLDYRINTFEEYDMNIGADQWVFMFEKVDKSFCPRVFTKKDDFVKDIFDHATSVKRDRQVGAKKDGMVFTGDRRFDTTYTLEYYKILDDFNFYGGDIRTKSIKTNNLLGDWSVVEYNYQELDNSRSSKRSSGRVAKSPYIRQEEVDDITRNSNKFLYFGDKNSPLCFKAFYIRDKFDYYWADPGVTYKTVSVKMRSSKDTEKTKRGKIVYNFYSFDDSLSVTTGGSKSTRGIYHVDNQGFHDYSAIVGQLRSMSVLNSEGEVVQKDSSEYIFSEELPPTLEWVDHDNDTLTPKQMSTSNQAIGLTGEMYSYIREYEEGSSSNLTNTQKRIANNLYKAAHITTIDNLHTRVSYLGFDPLTGNNIMTYSESPDNKVNSQLQISKPAYVDNDELLSKRMLTQSASSITMVDTIDVTTGKRDTVGDLILGAQYYEWQKQPYSTTISGQLPAYYNWKEWHWIGDSTTPENNSYDFYLNNTTGLNYQWENFNYVTAYNRWGVPYEEYNSFYDTYTTFIPGYSDYRVMATASNAKNSEVFYCSFEPYSVEHGGNWTNTLFTERDGKSFVYSTDAYSGTVSLDCKSSREIVKQISPGSLTASKGYLLSALIKFADKSGSVRLFLGDKDTTIQGSSETIGTWIRHDFDVSYASETEFGIEGDNCLIDEIRLHPARSEMVTYCFDTLTNNLITTCDLNSRRKSFAFDHFGRLTHVMNSQSDTIGEGEYRYLRDSLTDLTLEAPLDLHEVSNGESIDFKWTSAKLYRRGRYSLYLLDQNGDTTTICGLTDTVYTLGYVSHTDIRRFSWWVTVESNLGIEFESEKRALIEIPENLFRIRDITDNIVPQLPVKLLPELKKDLSSENQISLDNSYKDTNGDGWATFQFKDQFSSSMGSGKTLQITTAHKNTIDYYNDKGDGYPSGKDAAKGIIRMRFDLWKEPAEKYRDAIKSRFRASGRFGAGNDEVIKLLGEDVEFDDRRLEQVKLRAGNYVNDKIHIWYTNSDDVDKWGFWVKDWTITGSNENILKLKAMILIYDSGK